jgi:hypothetical protein
LPVGAWQAPARAGRASIRASRSAISAAIISRSGFAPWAISVLSLRSYPRIARTRIHYLTSSARAVSPA